MRGFCFLHHQDIEKTHPCRCFGTCCILAVGGGGYRTRLVVCVRVGVRSWVRCFKRICPFVQHVDFVWLNDKQEIMCGYVQVIGFLNDLLELWGEVVVCEWGVLTKKRKEKKNQR